MAERPLGPAGCGEELALSAAGFHSIAGVDEAGRGAWAGPLVAAAVMLPDPISDAAALFAGLRDSKQLTPRQRDRYCQRIHDISRAVGVGVVGAWVVDGLGLAEAGRLAMSTAIQALPLPPDFLLIDAFRLPGLLLPQRPIVFGDCLSLSIAAASVVAKVTRDRLMQELHARHPLYGFGEHKGYGTRRHQDVLVLHGPCEQHRASYAPIRLLTATRD